jgi:hypothetical protein
VKGSQKSRKVTRKHLKKDIRDEIKARQTYRKHARDPNLMKPQQAKLREIAGEEGVHKIEITAILHDQEKQPEGKNQ